MTTASNATVARPASALHHGYAPLEDRPAPGGGAEGEVVLHIASLSRTSSSPLLELEPAGSEMGFRLDFADAGRSLVERLPADVQQHLFEMLDVRDFTALIQTSTSMRESDPERARNLRHIAQTLQNLVRNEPLPRNPALRGALQTSGALIALLGLGVGSVLQSETDDSALQIGFIVSTLVAAIACCTAGECIVTDPRAFHQHVYSQVASAVFQVGAQSPSDFERLARVVDSATRSGPGAAAPAHEQHDVLQAARRGEAAEIGAGLNRLLQAPDSLVPRAIKLAWLGQCAEQWSPAGASLTGGVIGAQGRACHAAISAFVTEIVNSTRLSIQEKIDICLGPLFFDSPTSLTHAWVQSAILLGLVGHASVDAREVLRSLFSDERSAPGLLPELRQLFAFTQRELEAGPEPDADRIAWVAEVSRQLDVLRAA